MSVAATWKTRSSHAPVEKGPNICSLGAQITRIVAELFRSQYGNNNLSRRGASSMTNSCKGTLSLNQLVQKPTLLRVWEMMQRRPVPMFSFSSRLSKAGQPESMPWRTSSEMVTLSKVSCLRHGSFRGSRCIIMWGKRVSWNLAMRRVGEKRNTDNGSRPNFSTLLYQNLSLM